MTDPKEAAEEAIVAGTDITQEDTATAAPPGVEAPQLGPMEIMAKDRDEALAQAAELKDRVLRTLAEMENLRRRTEREIADAKTYGITSFARDLLSVTDNIRRAFTSVDADAIGADGPLKAFVEGIELTERDLLKVLDKHGVKEISPLNEKFDPNKHQAMFEIPNTDVPNGTVLQVMQAGYVIGERVLRPALVGVSKGGAKPEAAS